MSEVRWLRFSTNSPPWVFTVRSNSAMWRVMRLPSVVESRPIRSASSAPLWVNISSKVCSRWASMSRIMSLRDVMESASISALLPKCWVT